MEIFMFEVADDDRPEECVRVRVLSDDTIELTLFPYGSMFRDEVILSPKAARELARDLNSAARAAIGK